jgi:hypothetical protein
MKPSHSISLRSRCSLALVLAAALAGACGEDTTGSPMPRPKPEPRLAPEIGTGDHSPSSVQLTLIADASSGLRTPRDLAFNPLRPDELWVVNRGDDSVVIIFAAPSDDRRTERRKDGYALHFMARPSSIAFGGSETTLGLPGTFATCQETRNTYEDRAPPQRLHGTDAVVLGPDDLRLAEPQRPRLPPGHAAREPQLHGHRLAGEEHLLGVRGPSAGHRALRLQAR